MARQKEEIFSKINNFLPINEEITTKLEEFVDLLLKYNQRYNLIGKSTINDIWNRHILDAAQLMKFIDNKDIILGDFGCGAGIPGIILSILGIKEVHLIEKSYRKCEFLKLAQNISKNNVVVHQEMAQNIVPIKFDIITSRAFAPLDKLIGITSNFAQKDTISIFPKGKNLRKELSLIKNKNKFDFSIEKSLTSEEGNILIMTYKK